MPELKILAEVEEFIVFNKDTSEVSPEDWEKLSVFINDNFTRFDCFVVLHGFDNILFTASALSFLFQNTSRPIIFTTTKDKHFTEKQVTAPHGLKANFINALQIASLGFNDVGLVYGYRYTRANVSFLKQEEYGVVFDAGLKGVLGKVDFSFRLYPKNSIQQKGQRKLYRLDKNILVFYYNLFFNLKTFIESGKKSSAKGLVLEIGSFRTLPQKILSAIKMISKKTPVLIRAEEKILFRAGDAVVVSNMTHETAVTKFMWAVKQGKNIAGIKNLILKDISGETNV